MSFSNRPPSQSYRSGGTRSGGKRPGGSGGLPAWLVFLIAVALVFGAYYLWTGVRDFFRSGGLGIREATEQAQIIATSTQQRLATREAVESQFTPRPSATPIPECQDFVVIVDVAIVRSRPTVNSDVLDQIPVGETICVIGVVPGSVQGDADWYLIDLNSRTRRLDEAYLREDLIEALNPTPTPSNTFTPAPTVTPLPSLTPSETLFVEPSNTPSPSPTVRPSNTPDPRTPSPTPTRTPTPTDTPTPFMQSA